jgi:hypothetical protein
MADGDPLPVSAGEFRDEIDELRIERESPFFDELQGEAGGGDRLGDRGGIVYGPLRDGRRRLIISQPAPRDDQPPAAAGHADAAAREEPLADAAVKAGDEFFGKAGH